MGGVFRLARSCEREGDTQPLRLEERYRIGVSLRPRLSLDAPIKGAAGAASAPHPVLHHCTLPSQPAVTCSPPTSVVKWTWSPPARPVWPLRPISWPFSTYRRHFTPIAERCP